MGQTIQICRCPECGDSWLNDHYTKPVCECFNCGNLYRREENSVRSYRFVFDAIKRTKGEKAK